MIRILNRLCYGTDCGLHTADHGYACNSAHSFESRLNFKIENLWRPCNHNFSVGLVVKLFIEP